MKEVKTNQESYKRLSEFSSNLMKFAKGLEEDVETYFLTPESLNNLIGYSDRKMKKLNTEYEKIKNFIIKKNYSKNS
jgi:hypothetical protein